MDNLMFGWTNEELEQARDRARRLELFGSPVRGGKTHRMAMEAARRQAEQENMIKLKAITYSEREYIALKNLTIETNANVKTIIDAYCMGIPVKRIQEIAMRNPKIANEALLQNNYLEPLRASDIKRFSGSLSYVGFIPGRFAKGPAPIPITPRRKMNKRKAKRKQQKQSRRRNRI